MTQNSPTFPQPEASFWQGLVVAGVLSLSAAVSLGITRFAYALLLPPMRADLAWSYTLAGAMNTANAVGYLVGALTAPWLMRRWPVTTVLVVASLLASGLMAVSGFLLDATPLLAQRLLAGMASAWVFVAGGLLAARLGTWYPQRIGLLLGVVYGGVGWGIVVSAWVVPAVMRAHGGEAHAWVWAWWWLALACGMATLALVWPARFFIKKEALALAVKANTAIQFKKQRAKLMGDAVTGTTVITEATTTTTTEVGAGAGAEIETAVEFEIGTTPAKAPPEAASSLFSAAPSSAVPWRRLGYSLAGYACFGLGYIGYMTFVVALLREQGVGGDDITVFYASLGMAVVASARLWASLLDKAQGGGALAVLNALLGVAVVLPALFTAWPLMWLSGVLFGAVFLSVVASTTALVRHNLPVAQWPAGISAFTIVFAVGQIFGPSAVGWVADGPGGLTRGLLWSAVALWLGAVLAWRQRPLAR